MSNVRQATIKKSPDDRRGTKVLQPRRLRTGGTLLLRKNKCTLRTTKLQWLAHMLNHLLDEFEFTPDVLITPAATPVSKAPPQAVIDAQVETSKWLEELGATPDDEIFDQAQEHTARQAFASLVNTTDTKAQKNQLTQIKTPEAVKHLVGMLTAYDWHFVEQAKELRGYAVSQLLEETKHPDAKIRLRALELLGKVTEVALFTERVEVKKTEMSDAELEAKIKEKLGKMAQIIDVTDVTDVLEVTEKNTAELVIASPTTPNPPLNDPYAPPDIEEAGSFDEP